MAQEQPQRPIKYGDVVLISEELEVAKQPIAPQDAAAMQSAENQVLGQTQKGGPAPVMQSAATNNLQTGALPSGLGKNQAMTVTESIGDQVVAWYVDPNPKPNPENVVAPPPAVDRDAVTIGEALEVTNMDAFRINASSQTKEDEVAIVQDEEVEKLMQCLPKASHMGLESILVQYQGCWYHVGGLKNVITFQRHFQARDSDLIIASGPKTGNTWLKALLFAIINRVHNHSTTSQSPLLTKHPHELVYCLESDIYGMAFDYPQPHHLDELPSPRLLHTHLPYMSLPESIRTSGCRILYLSRNPLDTYISNWHFAISLLKKIFGEDHFELPSMEDYMEDCYQGRNICGPFLDHVLEYWKLSLEQPNKVLFLMYEDLKDDTVVQLKRLAEFVGLPFSPQEENEGVIKDIIELCDFKNMKELEVNKSGVINKFFEKKSYFRNGKVGDWTQYFTPSMVEKMNKLIEEKFDGIGLSFKFKSFSS